jgi:flagellar basal-body rod protein FlgG
MNNVLYIGATGLRAQQLAVDVVANNVANINTPAFKRNSVAFAELVAQPERGDATATVQRATEAGLGVSVAASPKVLEQGELRKTDNPLDVAIRGGGFVELLGPGGQTYLWRGGALRVNTDGFLAAANGLQLKTPISVPREAAAVAIADDGQVFAVVPGERSAQQIGQLELVGVADARSVSAIGDGLYRVDDPLADVSRASPGESGMGLIAQGYLEGSNVKMVDEMVNMVLMQRAYAANARLIQLADEMMNTVNQLRR